MAQLNNPKASQCPCILVRHHSLSGFGKPPPRASIDGIGHLRDTLGIDEARNLDSSRGPTSTNSMVRGVVSVTIIAAS
ncbi:MAG: hypothetical protein KA292_05275 [Sphingorhabdus sp.]|nr:hypothetical protein [Sphingorhabdus sp.]